MSCFLFFIPGRMLFSQSQESASYIHCACPVQLQTNDSRPSCCRQGYDGQGILAPLEVVAPPILSRMVESDAVTRLWIKSNLIILFAVVAVMAGEGKVL